MAPVYSGSADEWCYISMDTTGSVKSVDVIIDNFETQMKKPEGWCLESHQFTVNDTLWHIEFQDVPESRSESNLGVFIINDNKEDLTVNCKVIIVGIEDEVREFEGLIEAQESCGRGWPKFMTYQDCKDVLIDGKLKMKIEVKVLKEEVTVIHGKGKSSVLIPDSGSVHLKILEDKSFTDFRVLCTGKSFPCHKVFLMARSSVFKSMLESNMKEAKEGAVEFKNCNETVAGNYVKFFYTGQLNEEILKENVESFLDLGEKYDLAGLKELAEQDMIANLDKDNMVKFFLAGDLCNGKKIKAAAKSFLRQNRRSLVETEGWKDALKDRGDLVLELLEIFSKD